MSTTKYEDVTRSLQNLDDTDLTPENVAAIHDLINHCAAEGLSDSHQVRLIYALKTLLLKFTPQGFQLRGATEADLKATVAACNRSDYAEATKHKFRAALKKFYKVENGGEHPDKVGFFSVHRSRKPTSVTRDDLFTDEDLKGLLGSFKNTRDRAFTLTLYETAARPGELLSRSIRDFTSTEKGDFIHLEGLKGTPDRTNQLVRAGRVLREWLAQHPCGGELGDIADESAPLWVKTEQQACIHCGEIPHHHEESCAYEPDPRDGMNYAGYRRRFKQACERAGIAESKRRPYNLRHTRLTEVATFMGYEQLNKFAGWTPGSDRAKVYVHLNNEDVNQAIREEYGLDTAATEDQPTACPFCGTQNQAPHSECRTCGRPLSLEAATQHREKLRILERLAALEEQGVLDTIAAVNGEPNDDGEQDQTDDPPTE